MTVWFHEGLRFECARCGGCCGGEPGYVWVSEEEIEEIARYLSVGKEAFAASCLRRVDNRISLLEEPNGDCIFFRAGIGCSIYDARPRQCRTYPFWPRTMVSEAKWKEATRGCPCAGRGRLYTEEEILEICGPL